MKMKSVLFCCLLAAVAMQAYGERPDSIVLINEKPDVLSGVLDDGGQRIGNDGWHLPNLSFPHANSILDNINRPLNLVITGSPFTPGEASILRWQNGSFVAAGNIDVYPGLMTVDSGQIGVRQSLGRLSFYVGAVVHKYGYLRGVNTQLGLEASATYVISSRLSATVFGSFYRHGTFLPADPALLGYMGRSSFGGYMDYSISDHFGIQAGAQMVQNIGSRRYDFEPIATPYVKIGNGNAKVHIGLPVGQIIYGLIRR